MILYSAGTFEVFNTLYNFWQETKSNILLALHNTQVKYCMPASSTQTVFSLQSSRTPKFLKILAREPQKTSTRSNPIVRRLSVTIQEPTLLQKSGLEVHKAKKKAERHKCGKYYINKNILAGLMNSHQYVDTITRFAMKVFNDNKWKFFSVNSIHLKDNNRCLQSICIILFESISYFLKSWLNLFRKKSQCCFMCFSFKVFATIAYFQDKCIFPFCSAET